MVAVRAPYDAARVIADLRDAVGDEGVQVEATAILRVIRDNSWLSPLLLESLEDRRKREGNTLGVLGVAAPASVEQVLHVVEVATRHQVPITPRGSGTSNFGLVTPERGGVILDLRNLRGPVTIGDGFAHGLAGVVQGEMDQAARAADQELPVLTTTFASATTGGWVAGGHVGLGSSVYGAVWDGQILEARVVTATAQPRLLRLVGPAAEPVLHTFGTMGVIAEVKMRAVEARDWVEVVSSFPDFGSASAFVRILSVDPAYHHRVATAQEEALMPAFQVLSPAEERASLVLLIIDASQQEEVSRLATSLGGTVSVWQGSGAERDRARVSIAAMVYGHRMLWVKKAFPDAAFLHVYFDPDDPELQVRALKDRFGDAVLLEMKYIRSGWLREALGHVKEGTLPAAVITIRNGDQPRVVRAVMDFCDEAGIQYQNPHTSVIEENGLFRNKIASLLTFKREVDPHNLLNPGKFLAADQGGFGV